MPSWYIGLDVGGTHIDCVALSMEGERSEAHHIRPTDVVPEQAAVRIVLDFLKDLHIKREEVKAVALGWKHGRNISRSLEMVQQFAKERIEAHVYWDAETAFIGALPNQSGIVVLSGTGSVVYGRDESGRVHASGGWSPLLGDPGSAFALGQQALIAAMRARDGSGHPTKLSESIEEAHHKTLEELVVEIDGDLNAAVPRIASFAPLVFQLAEAGDTECVRIRGEAAEALAERLLALLKKWPQNEAITISYAGRLLLAQNTFRQLIQQRVANDGVTMMWRDPQFRPPYGAILATYPNLLETLTKADQSLDWHH